MVSHSCDSLICCLADKKNQPAEQGIGGNKRAAIGSLGNASDNQ